MNKPLHPSMLQSKGAVQGACLCRGLFKQVAAVRVWFVSAQHSIFDSQQGACHSTQVLTLVCCDCLCLLRVSLSPCCTTAAGVLAATGILTGVYYATPKETKDKIRRRVKKTTDE